MLDKLKSLNVDRMDLDEAVSLFTFGGLLESTYLAFHIETPTWLSASLVSLDEDIRRRVRDNLRARLESARARKDTLKTPSERRVELDAEIRDLERALGG